MGNGVIVRSTGPWIVLLGKEMAFCFDRYTSMHDANSYSCMLCAENWWKMTETDEKKVSDPCVKCQDIKSNRKESLKSWLQGHSPSWNVLYKFHDKTFAVFNWQNNLAMHVFNASSCFWLLKDDLLFYTLLPLWTLLMRPCSESEKSSKSTRETLKLLRSNIRNYSPTVNLQDFRWHISCISILSLHFQMHSLVQTLSHTLEYKEHYKNKKNFVCIH